MPKCNNFIRWEEKSAQRLVVAAAAAGSISSYSSTHPVTPHTPSPLPFFSSHTPCMYSTMINGYTRLNITKLDVLTGIPEIKVAVA